MLRQLVLKISATYVKTTCLKIFSYVKTTGLKIFSSVRKKTTVEI
jgi:hypothetical protein